MLSPKLTNEDAVIDCEILIIGAGPAGISTWLHLQKFAPQLAGYTIAIEKAVFPRDKLCAGGVSAWGGDVLEQLEVDLDIPSLFVSDVEFRFGNETYLLHQPDCFSVVQRLDFDHALVKTALSRGLELHEDETLIDVSRVQNELIVKTNKRKYRVKTLVGADGAFSEVRRKMMPPHKPRLAPTIQVFTLDDTQYDTEFKEKKIILDLTPISEGLQGYMWHVPCLKDDALSIAHGICDFRIYPDKPRASMKQIFSRELRACNNFQAPSPWYSHPIPWLSSDDTISQPNVLLVGDAAGIEPAFGGGIHIALSTGEIVAHEIIEAFQNNDFSFHNYKHRVQSHMVGKHIRDCTRLAQEMYAGRENPLKLVREFFTIRYGGPNLLLLLLAGNRLRHN